MGESRNITPSAAEVDLAYATLRMAVSSRGAVGWHAAVGVVDLICDILEAATNTIDRVEGLEAISRDVCQEMVKRMKQKVGGDGMLGEIQSIVKTLNEREPGAGNAVLMEAMVLSGKAV